MLWWKVETDEKKLFKWLLFIWLKDDDKTINFYLYSLVSYLLIYYIIENLPIHLTRSTCEIVGFDYIAHVRKFVKAPPIICFAANHLSNLPPTGHTLSEGRWMMKNICSFVWVASWKHDVLCPNQAENMKEININHAWKKYIIRPSEIISKKTDTTQLNRDVSKYMILLRSQHYKYHQGLLNFLIF